MILSGIFVETKIGERDKSQLSYVAIHSDPVSVFMPRNFIQQF